LAFNVVLYKEDDGTVPIAEWLALLDRKARLKLSARIRLLQMFGHELRRPIADYLRDGVYELRVSHMRMQYRILYFFNGNSVIVLSHGIRKTEIVPPIEIEKALERKAKYENSPDRHQERLYEEK
jgi:phage-related protein